MTENKVSEATGGVTYLPSLDSVRSHPVPDWFHDAKLGIFIHWGPYSIPAFAPHGTYDIGQLMAGKVGFEQVPYAEWYQNSLRVPGNPTETVPPRPTAPTSRTSSSGCSSTSRSGRGSPTRGRTSSRGLGLAMSSWPPSTTTGS